MNGYTQAMEYSSAFKKEIQSLTASINLEDVMHGGMSEEQILHNDIYVRNLQQSDSASLVAQW